MSIDSKLITPDQTQKSTQDAALQQFTRKLIWAPYDPKWNGTLGTGHISARFARVGGVCFFRIFHETAAVGQPGGTWIYHLPIATCALGTGSSDVQMFPIAGANGLNLGYGLAQGGSTIIFTNIVGSQGAIALIINGQYDF
jgi:hypothetical protein